MNIYHYKTSDPHSDLQIPSPSNTISVLASLFKTQIDLGRNES